MKKQELTDLHIHSVYSFDGLLSPEEIIANAKRNNVKWIAISDHNTLNGVRDLWEKHGADPKAPYITVDGVNIVSCVEVTCRVAGVLNNKNTDSKVHLQVFGADLSDDSPLVKVLDIKSKNDRLCDIGLLDYFLTSESGHGITEEDVKQFFQEKRSDNPGFTNFSSDDIRWFLEKRGVTVAASNRQYKRRLKEEVPRFHRINLFAGDLIRVAHASGGLVIMAHPSRNVIRTNNKSGLIAQLIRPGIDGFESIYNRVNEDTQILIEDAIEKNKPRNPVLYTGGSDIHDFYKGNTMGYVDEGKAIPMEEFREFFEEIEKLAEARKVGQLSIRNYPNVTEEHVERVIDDLNEQSKQAVTNPDGSPYEGVILPFYKTMNSFTGKKKTQSQPRNIEHIENNTEEIIDDQSEYNKHIAEMEERYSIND